MDGNSLGALPRRTKQRLDTVVQHEWGATLIESWNKHHWYDQPARLGGKLAKLIGARPEEVIVADSTSLNIFKAAAAALRMKPGRKIIISERANFPTDLYMLQGLIELIGQNHQLHLLDELDELEGRMTMDVALVVLTHVSYRTGRMLDMQAITRLVQSRGALILWDLAHSAGALPIELDACNADFAVGCGYKFLNGGPGAPAFIYIAQRHQAQARQPLQGWFGHAHPFSFQPGYAPAEGIRHFLCGTPSVLACSALEEALDLMLGVDLHAVRRKSVVMGRLFWALVQQECGGHGITLGSPSNEAQRGSQICLFHPHAYAIVQALIHEHRVVGDFRDPNIMRFGLTPLYTGFVDIWYAVQHLRTVLENEEYKNPEYQARAAVT